MSERGAVAVQLHGDSFVRPAASHQARQRFLESALRLCKRHPILRPFRPRQTRLHCVEVEFQRVGEYRIGRRVGAEHPLFFGIGFYQLDQLRITAGKPQISQRLVIHGEETDGRAIFRRHVSDGCSVRDAQAGKPRAVELDEFFHHPFFTQHLRDRENEIRGSGARAESAVQLEPDNIGDEHDDRLSEQCRLDH